MPPFRGRLASFQLTVAWALSTLLLAGDLSRAQTADAPSDSRTFEDETSVLVVEVPVQVLVSGKPLRGLTRESFEVYDKGERQELVGFEVLDLSTEPASADEDPRRAADRPKQMPPTALRRNFLLVFDFAYPSSWDRAYGAGPITTLHGMVDTEERVSGLLGESFHPTDRLAVGYMSPLRGFKLLQGWTSDRDQVLRAFEILRSAMKIDAKRVRELWPEWEPGRAVGLAAGGAESPWATVDDLVAEARTSSLRGDPTLPHREVVEGFIDGLIAARRELGEPPGPRHVVYMSAGFPIESLEDLQRLFREFRRTHWSIQAVSTAGLGWGADSMFLISYETGGQLYTNHNHVDVLLADMTETTAVTYLLSFQAKLGQPKGSFHKLRVKLADGPANARLIHRRGYYSPGSEDG